MKQIKIFVISDALTHNAKLTICKTCPSIYNVEKMSEPKRSIKIIDHFTCTATNAIYCITYDKKLYIGETGRWPGDQFQE